MLTIRLSRVGKAKQPSYRLVVSEKSKDPWGDYLENLGTYNTLTKPSTVNFKADRITHWIEKGAQVSDTVWNLLVDQGIVKGEKRLKVKLSKKRKAKIAKKQAA
ncbi:30S ribosomal protein S16 [Patescibacteria group bacterium]|jgi:small subunit ribosomal protein S16|nr:30S ribosomal protein S16 [Patescibacteria group bacterium]